MIKKIKEVAYKLLKKSEKWTKTDMIYLAKGGFWLSLGQIISTLSTFLLAIAFANLLPKETYGIYKYIMSIVAILSIPTLIGMNAAIIQAVARGYEGSVVPALKEKIKWGFLGGLASIITALYYYTQGDTTLTIAFLIAAIFIPFMDSLSLFESFLNGKKKFKKLASYYSAVNVLTSLAVIITILFTKNILAIIAISLGARTILRLYFSKKTIKKELLNTSSDHQTIKYGKHLSVMNALTIVSLAFDKVLVFSLLGPINLAIYAVAITPITQFEALIRQLGNLILPTLSNTKEFKITKSFVIKIAKFTFLLAIIAATYAIIAPLFFQIFFPEYIESIKYSQLFSITLIAAGPIIILITLLKAHKKTKQLYRYNIIKPIARIAAIAILTPIWGIQGVILAIIISQFVEIALLIQYK